MLLKAGNPIRSLGLGGLLCGGLAGLLFLLYPNAFPLNSTPESIMLIAALLGAACHNFVQTLFIKPFIYYSSLLELRLLRRQIGEVTRAEITRELTVRYFLGKSAARLSLRTPLIKEKRIRYCP